MTGHPPPPPPPVLLKPSYGRYHEFDTCDWCWKPANRMGLLWPREAKVKIRREQEDLHFCDEDCLALWRQHGERARAEVVA